MAVSERGRAVRACAGLLAAFASASCGGTDLAGLGCEPGTIADGGFCVPVTGDAIPDTYPGESSAADTTASSDVGAFAPDANAGDAASADATTADSAASDSSTVDTSPVDSTASDATSGDASVSDAGADSQTPETGVGDSSASDADAGDSGASEADASEADASDTGASEADAGDSSPIDASGVDSGSSDTGGPSLCTGHGAMPVVDGGLLIPLSGTLREIVIDSCNEHVYVSNEAQNEIEDYAIATGALASPILVGSQPQGFDITPDNRRMYVANTGGTNISVVDLSTRQELKKINVPPNSSNDTPYSLAIASNGKALFSTTFAGSGFGGRMMSLDLASEVVNQRTDFFSNGTTTEATIVKAGADRSTVAAVAGDISSGPVFAYHSAADTFSPERDLNAFVSRVAVSSDGTLILVNATYVFDGSLNLLGTVTGGGPWGAFGPSDAVAYRAATGAIEVLSSSRFLVTGSIPVTADTIQSTGGSWVGNLAVSSDGKWLAMITDHGITFVNLR
jgi:YVTN family beta-propeller protein